MHACATAAVCASAPLPNSRMRAFELYQQAKGYNPVFRSQHASTASHYVPLCHYSPLLEAYMLIAVRLKLSCFQ